MEKKPWWKSKIALLGIVMGTIGLSDLSFGWLSGQGVSTEQIQAVQTALPNLADQIHDAVVGKNYFAIISAVGGYVTAIWRIWFTDKLIG
ncbi:MAG: hypothetical protein R3A50_04855 [Saprospiraceae bacterium]